MKQRAELEDGSNARPRETWAYFREKLIAVNDILSFKIIFIFQMKYSLKFNFLFEGDGVGKEAGELAKKVIGS